MRHNVKVIIGGAPVSSKFAEDIGADAYASSAPHGVEILRTWFVNSGCAQEIFHVRHSNSMEGR